MSTQRSHHRFLHVPRLTGFRRPSQSAATSHGKAQLVEEVEQSLQQPQHYHTYNTMATQQRPQPPRVRFADEPSTNHPHHNRTHSSSNGSSNTHSNPVSTASSRSSFELEPTSAVAEWCHQMHIMQRRRYDWCQACYPRPVQVAAPTEEEVTMAMVEARRAQMVERVRRERQAAHAYQ
jgi:hypothetical protein